MYPYMPQNEDELELIPGDFVFMSPVDQSSTSEGWVYGTSLSSGLSGLLPENYVSLADEADTWVFHGWAECLSFLSSHTLTWNLSCIQPLGFNNMFCFVFLFVFAKYFDVIPWQQHINLPIKDQSCILPSNVPLLSHCQAHPSLCPDIQLIWFVASLHVYLFVPVSHHD